MTSDERLKKARELRAAGNQTEALSIAIAVSNLEPENADAWWVTGLALHSLGKLEEALEALRKVGKLAPKFASGFAQYGVVLAESGQPEQARRALDHALRLDPGHAFALRQAAKLAGDQKDEESRIRYLERLNDNGDADGHDLNLLGIAHWRRKHFFRAIEYYKRSAHVQPGPAALFNLGLVYNHNEVSQDVDAIDSLKRALLAQSDYEHATKKLAEITPRLEVLARCVGRYDETFVKESDWFEHYINPYELLRVDPDLSLPEIDAKLLKRLKRELLQEISLEEGRISWMEGHVVDQSKAIGLCEELNDEKRRAHHWIVFSNKRLLRFLTRGEHRLFTYERDYFPEAVLDALESDPGFRTWLSAPFSRQYARVLSEAFDNSAIYAIESLFDGRRWVLPEHDDVCFEKAHAKIKSLLSPLAQLALESKERAPSDAQVEMVLAKNKLVDVLNLLPTHFRELQSEAVGLVRGIAIDAYNKHGDADQSRAILHLSKRFNFKSAELTERLKEDFDKIEELIREERKHEAKLASGKTAWEVTKNGVRQGDKVLSAAAVSSIRWGIMISGYQHAPKYEFLMAFRDDQHKEVVFSWSASNNIEKQQEHFSSLVQAALAYIAPVIMKKIVTKLDQGKEITIGSCILKKDGVHFSTQGWFFSKNHIVPWGQVTTKIQNGQLFVMNRADPRTSTSMALRDTENAIALQFLSHGTDE
ncbi:MAG: tetratricopeptide repeat protein [Verrucomicrobia bacterium]|nr:tetratricopeptide repeat protein [Verrucomicrobiota bacterium]